MGVFSRFRRKKAVAAEDVADVSPVGTEALGSEAADAGAVESESVEPEAAKSEATGSGGSGGGVTRVTVAGLPAAAEDVPGTAEAAVESVEIPRQQSAVTAADTGSETGETARR
ncbi:hypothetical protein [Streptomyces filamentosus]|uniref:hypothetical protein n=1 Tax=Streptomyces filamentosus TaxID=67294 RepID=UPI0012397136|nr:hypothetical protein [Streptomyces filamentosus]KAA6211717.1 hypothetical protein CP979_35665 [Streptomyces filamentosus]